MWKLSSFEAKSSLEQMTLLRNLCECCAAAKHYYKPFVNLLFGPLNNTSICTTIFVISSSKKLDFLFWPRLNPNLALCNEKITRQAWSMWSTLLRFFHGQNSLWHIFDLHFKNYLNQDVLSWHDICVSQGQLKFHTVWILAIMWGMVIWASVVGTVPVVFHTIAMTQ